MNPCVFLKFQGKCLLVNNPNMMRFSLSDVAPGQAGVGDSMTISTAIARLLEAKSAGNRKPVYVSSLAHYLNRFAKGRETMLLTATDFFDYGRGKLASDSSNQLIPVKLGSIGLPT